METPLFAAQGAHQPLELAVEQGEARLKIDGVLRVVGLLDLQIDGVLVQ